MVHRARKSGAQILISATEATRRASNGAEVLARLEGRALLDALLDRFTTVSPAGDIERTPSSIIAGVRAAPLQFG